LKQSIAVIGQGFVGGSLTTVFSERGIDVYVYDKSGKVAQGGDNRFVNVNAHNVLQRFVESCDQSKNFSSVYFVCLPTPMFENGEADLSIVEGVLKELSECAGNRIAVIKSTIPPGSTERWNKMFEGTGLSVVFNPEFLREASALEDMRNQDRIILGGPKKAVNKVRDIFRAAFPNVPIHKTSSTNAEFVKYTANCFLSVKVSFANELYQMVNKFNPEEADYDRIVELATLDKRLGDSHWKVPGPMPADDDTGQLLPGFAGSCFVKDINAFMYLANKLGVDPKVMRGAWEKNLEVRPGRDWERLIGRAVSKKTKKDE
jgi:UDPglucose 6-dehydrogenase